MTMMPDFIEKNCRRHDNLAVNINAPLVDNHLTDLTVLLHFDTNRHTVKSLFYTIPIEGRKKKSPTDGTTLKNNKIHFPQI